MKGHGFSGYPEPFDLHQGKVPGDTLLGGRMWEGEGLEKELFLYLEDYCLKMRSGLMSPLRAFHFSIGI